MFTSPENTHIVVDKTGEDKDYDNFTEQLPEAEPRYAIYGQSLFGVASR